MSLVIIFAPEYSFEFPPHMQISKVLNEVAILVLNRKVYIGFPPISQKACLFPYLVSL